MVQKINPHPALGRRRIPPILCIYKRCNSWECSVHFFRAPCIILPPQLLEITGISCFLHHVFTGYRKLTIFAEVTLTKRKLNSCPDLVKMYQSHDCDLCPKNFPTTSPLHLLAMIVLKIWTIHILR